MTKRSYFGKKRYEAFKKMLALASYYKILTDEQEKTIRMWLLHGYAIELKNKLNDN